MKIRQNAPAMIISDRDKNEHLQQFEADVRYGLGASPKSLPCVYFYDKTGSQLFEKICLQPEYYCTRAEREILKKHANNVAASCHNPLQIVELGSGSSVKTRILLEAFAEAHMQITYIPIDISLEILSKSASELRRMFPLLKVKPISARYEDGVKAIDTADGTVLLVWLGSSIGNYKPKDARRFLAELRQSLSHGDKILLGADLIKDPAILEAAYNDRSGVTADFNLNLLARINRELGGAFILDRFSHNAVFNEPEGRIEMYLISRCDQQVHIEALDMTVAFSKGERIHTENSYKYHPEEIVSLAEDINASLVCQWFDSRRQFSLSLFETENAG